MKVEICKPLKLTPSEETKLAMHSFCNVFNVIITQLMLLQEVLHRKDSLNTSISLCWKILSTFSDAELAMASARNMNLYKDMILRDVNEALEGIEVEPSLKHIVDNSAENLRSIFEICDVRVKEFVARMDDSGDWKIFSTEYIADNLRQVLDVIAHNSQGRYGIVYRSDRQGTNDYLVTIDIRSVDGSTITFPAVFQDIFRDIVANARKYTLPGGKISASLIDDGKEISLIVSDTGRGIPADEIEKVVEFGTRGTNTSENETKGGGFGLTKAYYNCIKYGGRMWIDSEPNAGTTITIKIPRFGNK